MTDIYPWLFDHYALPQLKPLGESGREAAAAFAGRLFPGEENRIHMIDFVDNLCLHWGTEAFALGVRLGLGLNGPRLRSKDCAWLMDFLSQLDDPVS